ncbi:glutaminyl-peptide cyclotransferase [Corynebacterium hansenii]|uniref:Glutaminyl-peptide cyclotransferase n=1 Tax=Corynebacterium hansenii TaxID=394964 RepID=A0ABV7ZR33_9CORY|nr:glutaminyl-peptide cyclotransferase [Corynebacterium hansenii]WJZ00883.1 Glutamine cyclotransferase [Corynebacterium hansenii]
MKLSARAALAGLLPAVVLLAGCSGDPLGDGPAPATSAAPVERTAVDPVPAGVPRLRVEVVAEHPFDAGAFTQGLEIDGDGALLVGTGQYGQSAIWRVRDWRAGSPAEDRRELPPELFGEGIARAGDTVWQLTWREGVAIARDAATLEETRRAAYPGEGWGLCGQGDRLVMSDGSHSLTFRDPATFAETGRVDVTAGGAPVGNLNELECVDGPGGPEVWANRWLTDDIVRIDPATGEVTGVADAAALARSLPPEARAGADVLNGIARIPGADRFLVTGKYWPTLFEVRFLPVG